MTTSSNKWMAFLTLFGSLSTLLCCALPALLVALGLGGALAGLIGVFPQIVWVSQHKPEVFSVAGLLILFGGWLQWRARLEPCPIDPQQAAACRTSRRITSVVYSVSVVLYLIGAFFAFAF